MREWIIVCALLGCFNSLSAQEWWFWPKYTLPGKASNYPGHRINSPESRVEVVDNDALPLLFRGEEPTQRLRNFFSTDSLPSQEFSIEMWIVDHVNQPVGALATLKDKYSQEEPEWLLGIYDRAVIFSLRTSDVPFANLISLPLKQRGWKGYWTHLVGVYTGTTMELYVNGTLASSLPVGKRLSYDPLRKELEVAAYMKSEPFMQLGNFLKMLRITDRQLAASEVEERFTRLQDMVEEGKLFPDTFHFNAGPYLNSAGLDQISILWETDRPAGYVIEYGEKLPMDRSLKVETTKIQMEPGSADQGNIAGVTLSGLKPGTSYFYNVKALATDGSITESGVLTFSTAVASGSAFAFAVIGDTEARPHINDRISKLIWDERPNFVLNVGDLTDGGMENHKFEWNFEYFQGVTQLASRVPVFPVAGNGEADLHWYKRYHALPDPEGYYTFEYGNAQFFMLDSNRPDEFSPGGVQYKWLEEALQSSHAKWKFVALHHAPYSSDDDDYSDSWKGPSAQGDERIRTIVPLFEKYNVDLVFFGHLHTYQRTLPIRAGIVDRKQGVIYIQGGGGGGNLEDFAPSRAWFSAKTYRGHHYFMISVVDDELNLKMYDVEGRLKDYLDITRE